MTLRNLYALMGILLLLATTAVAGSFTAEMDVKTYVDASNANQTFADGDLLWAASQGGEPEKLTYLSVINMFGSQGIFKPEQIASATLTLDAAQVDNPGKVKAYFMHGETFDTRTWYDKDEYDSEVFSPSVSIDKDGSYTLDVTPLIKKAIETCTEGCGYSIIIEAEDDASVGFASGRGSGEGPVLKYEIE
jgi:hypothetical protein